MGFVIALLRWAYHSTIKDHSENILRGFADARPRNIAVCNFPLGALVAGKKRPLHLIKLPLISKIPLLCGADLSSEILGTKQASS